MPNNRALKLCLGARRTGFNQLIQPMRFATLAVHAGQSPDRATGAVMPPIYQTATYMQPPEGETTAYEYGRAANPTRTVLENNLAGLEGASHGVAFASGMSATDAILRALRPGDHIIASEDMYGGNYRYLKLVLAPMGVRVTFTDLTSVDVLAQAVTSQTKVIWVESPTNPLIQIVDLSAVCACAQLAGAAVVVDNTFASPYLQQPLSFGADMVLHSTTKYLGGHSDIVGGFVCTNDEKWADHLRFQVKCVGAIPGPMDCFLALRGTKTLHIRMERHCSNAQKIATFLDGHPKVVQVNYPGLQSHPGHALAKSQMNDFGGMLSMTLKTSSSSEARRVLHSLRVFAFAESLGGVESLAGHPATMSHGALSSEERARLGVTDNLVRLSVGIEDSEDLLEDLEQALSQI